jgi:hypothetical protein
MKSKVKLKLKKQIYEKVFNRSHLNEIDLDTICKSIEKNKKAIQRLRAYYLSYENDLRSGYETYGYESLESIMNRLEYISDRFAVAFRLSWLLKVPDEVRNLRANN